MNKIKEFIEEHKDKIIAIMMLLVTFFSALLSMGGKVAIFSTIMIAVIELVIFYIRNGLSDDFMELCVATTKLIVDVINGEYTKTKTVPVTPEPETVVSAAKPDKDKPAPKNKKIKVCILTEEMIRDILTKNTKDDENETK